MTEFVIALDALIGASALVSAWFWWLASRQRLRRISRRETFDAADMNRVVTTLNRTQILNARAALATACAALLAAARIALGYLGG